MSDIFISYNHKDKTKAKLFAHAFEQEGWSVFWDKDIPPGKTFDQYIGERLAIAKCIVVLWSEGSVHSDWVKEEAQRGAQRKILVPVLIDEVPLPLGFGRIEAAELHHWQGDTSEEEFQNLLKAIKTFIPQGTSVETEVGRTMSPTIGSPSSIGAATEKEPTITSRPEPPQKNKKYAFGGLIVVAVLIMFFFVSQEWREPATPPKPVKIDGLGTPTPSEPVNVDGLGVVFGSDKNVQAAQDEIRRASTRGVPNAKLFFRNGYYASIAVVDNKATARKYLAIVKRFRSDAYVARMDTWCRNPQSRDGFVECQSSK